MQPPAPRPTLAQGLPATQAARLRDTARVVGWGLTLYAAASLVSTFLKGNATGSLGIQAVVAEFGAGRLNVTWSDPHEAIPTTSSIARRAGKGALLGFAAATFVLAFACLTRGASVGPTAPAPSMLVLGLLTGGLVAMRDELLLRGVVLRALRDSAPTTIRLAVCGLAGAAASIGSLGTTDGPLPWKEPLLAGLLALGFAVLWLHDHGAWLAWGAHVGWLWTTGTLARGGAFDLRWAPGGWGGGDMKASTAAVVAVSIVAAAALVVGARARRAPGRRAPG